MPAPPEPIGIGFIGAGDVSQLHAQAVRRVPGARLVGLWNRTPERGRERAAAYGCRAYGSAEDLVSDPAVTAVFVLTHHDTHLRYARLALEAGKAVLVEKPVAADAAEIEEMKRAAERAGVACMPGHNYIYEAGMARTRELVASGALGTLVAIYVMYHIFHPEDVAARYPGVIRTLLSHHAYILLYLAGRPRRLQAMKARLHYREIPQEDLAMVQMELGSGALAHFTASFAADDHSGDPWTVLVKVIGTGGATRYSYRDWVENKRGIVHSQTYSAYQGTICNEVRHFIEVCLRSGGAPLSTLDDAIEVERIIDACDRSIAEERTVTLATE